MPKDEMLAQEAGSLGGGVALHLPPSRRRPHVQFVHERGVGAGGRLTCGGGVDTGVQLSPEGGVDSGDRLACGGDVGTRSWPVRRGGLGDEGKRTHRRGVGVVGRLIHRVGVGAGGWIARRVTLCWRALGVVEALVGESLAPAVQKAGTSVEEAWAREAGLPLEEDGATNVGTAHGRGVGIVGRLARRAGVGAGG